MTVWIVECWNESSYAWGFGSVWTSEASALAAAGKDDLVTEAVLDGGLDMGFESTAEHIRPRPYSWSLNINDIRGGVAYGR